MKQNALVKKGPTALSKPAVVLALPAKRQQQTRSRQPQATRRRGKLGTIRVSQDEETSSCDEDASREKYPRAALGPPNLTKNGAASFQAVSRGSPACTASAVAGPQSSLAIGPMSVEISYELCMARVWNSGRGGQCTKRRMGQGSEFCSIHCHKHSHGRVDGPVPPAKLAEFQKSQSSSSSVRATAPTSSRGGGGAQMRRRGRGRVAASCVGHPARSLDPPARPLDDVQWFSEEDDDESNAPDTDWTVSRRRFFNRVAFFLPPCALPGARVCAANEALEEVLLGAGSGGVSTNRVSTGNCARAGLHVELRVGDFVRAHCATSGESSGNNIGEVCQLFQDCLGMQWARWRRFLPSRSVVGECLASGKGNEESLASEDIDERELIETSDFLELPFSALSGSHVHVVGVSSEDAAVVTGGNASSGGANLLVFFCRRALCGEGSGLLWEVAFDNVARRARRKAALGAFMPVLVDEPPVASTFDKGNMPNTDQCDGDVVTKAIAEGSSFSSSVATTVVHSLAADAVLRRAAAALRPCAFRGRLPGREVEQAEIGNFISGAVREGGRSQVLYVSGMPGTGKTASVLKVVQRLQTLQSINPGSTCPPFIFAHVNAMCLSSPGAVFGEILRKIPSLFSQELVHQRSSCSEAHAYSALNELFTGSRDPERDAVVLLLDEIDSLVTKAQTVLYRLFDLLARPNSRLVVVAIANTMDLPERLLPRVASRLGVLRVNFAPYDRPQILAILRDRLSAGGAADVFSDDALALCGARVAAASGDVRKALQVCRRAVEERSAALAGDNADENSNDILVGDKLVTMQDLQSAEAALLRANPSAEAIARLGLKARRFLLAIVLELRRQRGSEMLSLRSVVQRYEAIMRTHEQRCELEENEAPPRHADDCLFTMQRLATISILRVHHASRFRDAASGESTNGGVLLELGDSIDVDDVTDALVCGANDDVAQGLLGRG